MHSHSHHHHHHHGHGHGRALGLALALTVTVLVVELAGAWWSGSLALLSDAAHMFTDAAALGISLLAVKLSRRPADRRRSFGYQRFEILAATLNALLLLAAAAYIVVEALRRVRHPAAVDADLMLAIAVVGLVVNLIAMRLLASGQQENLNVRGAYLEVWSDMLGSIGVIAGAIAIRFTGWMWIDSIIAVGIGLWVLPRSVALLRTSVNVLLEGVPEGVDSGEVEQALLACEGVQGVHELHVWAIGSDHVSLSVHVVTGPDPVHESVLACTREMLARRFDIHHTTVQVETTPCEQHDRMHTSRS